MKNIYIHIGFPKTGTTTIQEFLYINRQILLENNYLYPSSLPSNHSVPFIRFFKNDTINDYDHNLESKWDKEPFINELKANGSIENLIISGEGIITLNEKSVQDMVKFFEQFAIEPNFKIICFIRDPIDFATSLVQQRTKLLKSKFVFKKNIFRKEIQPFIDVFSISNIKLIKYEDVCNTTNGLIDTFLKEINWSVDNIEMLQSPRLNASTSDVSYEILNFIAFISHHIQQKGSNIHIAHKDVFPLTRITGKKFELSPFEIKKLRKLFSNDIKWIDKKFNIKYNLSKNINLKETIISYDNIYFDELKMIFPKLQDSVKYLVYHFLQNKIENCGDDLSLSFFKNLTSFVESEYSCLTSGDFFIKDYKRLLKKYNKIQKSKYPNLIV